MPMSDQRQQPNLVPFLERIDIETIRREQELSKTKAYDIKKGHVPSKRIGRVVRMVVDELELGEPMRLSLIATAAKDALRHETDLTDDEIAAIF